MGNTGQKMRGQQYFSLERPISADMEAFDTLPATVRHAVNNAVGRYSGIDVKQVWTVNGTGETLRMIDGMNRAIVAQSNRERGIA